MCGDISAALSGGFGVPSWAEPLRNHSRLRVLSPRTKERQTAIGLVTMEGARAESLQEYLHAEHGLFTAVHKFGDSSAIRITPGLPTSMVDIERLLDALDAATSSGRI